MKTIFRISLAISLVASLFLSSCTENKKKKQTREMTTEELKEKYGAKCVELGREASRLVANCVFTQEINKPKLRDSTFRKALILIEQAIEANPKYPYIYTIKADYYIKLKDYDNALKCFKKCESLLPEEEQGTNYFSEAILEYKRGNQEEMQRLFRKSLDINNKLLSEDPYNLWAIGEKAYLLSILGHKDKAQKFLDSYKGDKNIDQETIKFFCEGIKVKHLLENLGEF